MAGKIEIRASGAKFRFVVLNRTGDKLMQSGPFDDKPSAKRAATALTKAVSGADISDATKPAAAAPKKASAAKKAAAPKKAAVAKKAAAPKKAAAAKRTAAPRRTAARSTTKR